MKSANAKARDLKARSMSTLRYYKLDSITPPKEAYWRKAKARMLQLRKQHMISQEYVLPVPYLCQIYHLLNLKHLEAVHNLSLKGLKINRVSQFEPTAIGGTIKFQTALAPSLNLLRIWRRPEVEAKLTLHTPYMIELNVPVYGDKQITVIFNVLPLGDRIHKLYIDMYSNLVFPKPILKLLLHYASGITVLEDLPYLYRLAKGNIGRSIGSEKVCSHQTMQLFRRFFELYGSSLHLPTGEAIELPAGWSLGQTQT
jgi:hypothetical protein